MNIRRFTMVLGFVFLWSTASVPYAHAIDFTEPTVSKVTPITATYGAATTFSVTYSDGVGVTSCRLLNGGVNMGTMTLSGTTTGTATYSYTPTSTASLSLRARCTDAAGNYTAGTAVTVTVSAAGDTTAPAVNGVSYAAGPSDSVTFTINASDAVGISSCTLYVDGVSQGAVTSEPMLYTYHPSAAGTVSVYATCVDAAGNTGTGPTASVAVTYTDTTDPAVGVLTPTTATAGSAVTFSATVSDAVGVASCALYIDYVSQGAMSISSGIATKSYTPSTAGTIISFAICLDAAGNSGTGTPSSVTVSAAAASDATAPSVGVVTPTTATVGTEVIFSVSASDSVGVTSCSLYIGGVSQGGMNIVSGSAIKAYTPSAAGTVSAYVTCVDLAGNTGTGAATSITISSSSTSTTTTTTTAEESSAVEEAAHNTLIKLACGVIAYATDPCHAVYYYDGSRHAFPNEKVFFTWYQDFDDVIVVTDDFMASATLGKNVTYHPGTRMVKFITVRTVYAVGESGELRAVASEDVAVSIWGSDWNTQIDDISDAFFGNYEFGEAIDSTSDFDPDAVEASVTNIAEMFTK